MATPFTHEWLAVHCRKFAAHVGIFPTAVRVTQAAGCSCRRHPKKQQISCPANVGSLRPDLAAGSRITLLGGDPIGAHNAVHCASVGMRCRSPPAYRGPADWVNTAGLFVTGIRAGLISVEVADAEVDLGAASASLPSQASSPVLAIRARLQAGRPTQRGFACAPCAYQNHHHRSVDDTARASGFTSTREKRLCGFRASTRWCRGPRRR